MLKTKKAEPFPAFGFKKLNMDLFSDLNPAKQ
jgi:hypothetical protein